MSSVETDDVSIDTMFIHWGYLNCCETTSKGKKSKREKWRTYWVEICGSTLRLFEDKSLHIESNLFPPPSDPNSILKENERKVAFLHLEDSGVKMMSNETFSRIFRSRSKKSDPPKVFRRHLFQLKLNHVRSTYVFQAPSHSTMLRWVSKLQESLDAPELDKKKSFPEERLKLVRDMLEKRAPEILAVDETDDDTISILSFAGDTIDHVHPSLKTLRDKRAAKREQLWQFEMQIIEFLGRGKGKFKREEFKCATKQDYLLIPTRTETFIPAGTKVTIFGQLPNRRWRCLIERNEVIKVVSDLLQELRETKQTEDTLRNPLTSNGKVSFKKDETALQTLLDNLPDYPLIGCIPTSVLELQSKRPSARQKRYIVTIRSSSSINTQKSSSTPTEETKIELQTDILDDDARSNTDTGDIQRGHERQVDGRRFEDSHLKEEGIEDSSGLSEGEGTSEEEEYVSDLISKVKLRNFGEGIVIRKKLRQKGISIIVGSSSSEGEEENYDDEDSMFQS